MKVARLTRAALVMTAAALLSCGEPPLSPVPPPQADLIGSLLQGMGLLACTPMPTATATQTVGSAGGGVKIGPPMLSVPARAPGAPGPLTATGPPVGGREPHPVPARGPRVPAVCRSHDELRELQPAREAPAEADRVHRRRAEHPQLFAVVG